MKKLKQALQGLTDSQYQKIGELIFPNTKWKVNREYPTQPNYNGVDLTEIQEASSRCGYIIQLDFRERENSITVFSEDLYPFEVNADNIADIANYLNSLEESSPNPIEIKLPTDFVLSKEPLYSEEYMQNKIDQILRGLTSEDLFAWQNLDKMQRRFEKEGEGGEYAVVRHVVPTKNQIISNIINK